MVETMVEGSLQNSELVFMPNIPYSAIPLAISVDGD